MHKLIRVLVISFVLICTGTTLAHAATSCEDLAKLKLANTTVTLAQPVLAGAFTAPPVNGRGGGPITDLPAFCRVQATLKPSSDSNIKMELWMPVATNWNGKLR